MGREVCWVFLPSSPTTAALRKAAGSHTSLETGLELSSNQNQMRSKCGQKKAMKRLGIGMPNSKNESVNSLPHPKKRKKWKLRTNFQWAGIPRDVSS